MPGVPTSRGCDHCRKQKKKCIADSSPCERCSRLRLRCVGLGQRRFKFVAEKSQCVISTKTVNAPSCGLSNGQTATASALVSIIDPSICMELNLLCNFGGFMADVPRRLGTNKALDAAVEALVAAFSHFRTGTLKPNSYILQKHGNALGALRSCLGKPATAHASETLCAVQLIMVYQVFLGGGPWITHAPGIVQILRNKGFAQPSNEFEKEILVVQSGSLIIEALMNNRVCLTKQEWIDLVEHKIDNQDLDYQVMRVLARVPSLMKRGRDALVDGQLHSKSLIQLSNESQDLRDRLRPLIERNRALLDKDDLSGIADYAGPDPWRRSAHAFRSRSYGLALMAGIILNCVSESIDKRGQGFSAQSQHYAQEIIKLAKATEKYRPLGSMCMIAYLSAAYIATDDPQLQIISATLLHNHRTDFTGPSTKPLIHELEWLRDRFMLRESGNYEEVFQSYV